ncbi:hypothetical protein BKA93DRAFT_750564 [Sparassis latifolia]
MVPHEPCIHVGTVDSSTASEIAGETTYDLTVANGMVITGQRPYKMRDNNREPGSGREGFCSGRKLGPHSTRANPTELRPPMFPGAPRIGATINIWRFHPGSLPLRTPPTLFFQLELDAREGISERPRSKRPDRHPGWSLWILKCLPCEALGLVRGGGLNLPVYQRACNDAEGTLACGLLQSHSKDDTVSDSDKLGRGGTLIFSDTFSGVAPYGIRINPCVPAWYSVLDLCRSLRAIQADLSYGAAI